MTLRSKTSTPPRVGCRIAIETQWMDRVRYTEEGFVRGSQWIGLVLFVCGTLACAGDDSDRPPGLDYAERAGADFPSKGMTLQQTLDNIVARRTTNAMVTARDV